MGRLLSRFRDLLFVPRCAGCGERLLPGGGALCEACYASYDLERNMGCPFCGAPFASCVCPGETLKRGGVTHLPKLFRYHPHGGGVSNRMIYLLKHRAPRPLVELLARELAAAIRPYLPEGKGELLVTFAPRSRRAGRRYGLDHMAILSRAVAKELGAEWRQLLLRRDGGEQKKYPTRRERFQNMKGAYSYIGREELRGRRILLLDDVTTSGATLLFALRALRHAGARKIAVGVLGATMGI